MANNHWESGPALRGSVPVPPSRLALLPNTRWASQDSQQCSQQNHAWLSLFFFPFWATLSADTADELFRAHQRPWGSISLRDYTSFKSLEVINAKAKESINLICFHQSKTKRERRWKFSHKRFETFTCNKSMGLGRGKFVKTQTLTNTGQHSQLMMDIGKFKAPSPSPSTYTHVHARSHILLYKK